MIHSVLEFLTDELNTFIKLKVGDPTTTRIYLSGVTNEAGIAIPDQSLGISLINIEEERVNKDQQNRFVNAVGKVEKRNPEIRLNLYVLITANFQNKNPNNSSDDYVEGLKQLSYAISFFQSKNVFTPENSPGLGSFDPNLQKIVVELYSYSFEQLYNFWSVVGAKYLPSVLYKIKTISIQENAVLEQGEPIEQIFTQSQHKS
ncbi:MULTISPECIES: DUF4255 domain-containing protein [Algoriphagus]|jgi:hypothetical protein|uniref:DUF4255 domain-containing protein n=3 Tax=Algoriphagus TaxID=246875 RepID=A0ABS7N5A2_9BACT|nr:MULTISPECIES: DUF4255 domain-containing protein [Algoriphagus]KPQ09870.1 MAG: Protein of unknown function (DUF4255) [Algoriphagus marincola HL-49]MBY5951514.1 DUF4255 domain-containing protein [Algoriphagus marincola]MCR9083613.1 DUF4255 domain-containing protein [Cyclobacteriaceae bacterium]TDK45489.1 DUF4255 domain-containing protein [Algoriphagus aquimaris]